MESKVSELSSEQSSIMMDKIQEYFIAGVKRTDIRELIKSSSPIVGLNDGDCDELIQKAMLLMQESTYLDSKQVQDTHIGFYEEVYSYFKSINHTEGMLRALKGKERFLNMISNGPKVTLNNKTTVNNRPEPQYDWNRLSSTERERMQFLLDKATNKE